MPIRNVGKLQIEPEALSQSTLFWTVQKIVAIFLILILIGAFFGLTGPGILGPSVMGNKTGSIWISYDRFARENAINKFQLTIDSSQFGNIESIDVSISSSYLTNFEIKQILPTPLRSESKGDNIVFTFAANQPKNVIIFLFEPQKIGSIVGVVGATGMPSLTFKQFIYP